MDSIITSIGLKGLEGYCVDVEVKSLDGQEAITIIGLPDATIKESKDRVRGAITTVDADIAGRELIILLSPAELKKNGPLCDLAMAIGILQETNQLHTEINKQTAFLGALSLDGTIHPVEGMMAAVLEADKQGIQTLYIPHSMELPQLLQELSINLVRVHHLQDAINHLHGQPLLELDDGQPADSYTDSTIDHGWTDFSDIIGHASAKRALMIAAAGNHHTLLTGPPGCGKSLLASALPSIMPRVTPTEQIMAHSIYQLAHETRPFTPFPPYRHPHHSSSAVSLIGGGTVPKPGEVSLAHGGVLFLDEMAEFSRKTLDMLRQPLESGQVTISRVSSTVTFPSKFLLIGASNSCPCGYKGSNSRYCICTPKQVLKYQQRISGPLLDRMDIKLTLHPVNLQTNKQKSSKTSAEIRPQVEEARQRQHKRYQKEITNNEVPMAELEHHSPLTTTLQQLLTEKSLQYYWSNRTQVNIIRTARSIADFEGQDTISEDAIQEAITWRETERAIEPHNIRLVK